jgi:Zn-dependent M28 family amino/carboxypeptidase
VRDLTLSRRLLATVAALVTAAALALGCHEEATGPEPTDLEPAALGISEVEMLGWIARISDDSTRGRETPTPELDEAAEAIAAHFQGLGLQPYFGASYLQRFPYGGGTGPNVAAVLPGRDEDLSGEYVVFVAHLDHKGITTAPLDGDSILNGADDNASGVAAVLEIAQAFLAVGTAPRRSVIFLLVSGEEHGMLGSRYFVAQDSARLFRFAGAVDFDMISRNTPDSLYVGGLTASTMGDAVQTALSGHPSLGFQLLDIRSGGSDHVAFWERGVPFLMFHSGLHADYHKVTDEVGRVDAGKATRTARLGFYAGWAVAEEAAQPSWKPGWPAPPTEAAVAR